MFACTCRDSYTSEECCHSFGMCGGMATCLKMTREERRPWRIQLRWSREVRLPLGASNKEQLTNHGDGGDQILRRGRVCVGVCMWVRATHLKKGCSVLQGASSGHPLATMALLLMPFLLATKLLRVSPHWHDALLVVLEHQGEPCVAGITTKESGPTCRAPASTSPTPLCATATASTATATTVQAPAGDTATTTNAATTAATPTATAKAGPAVSTSTLPWPPGGCCCEPIVTGTGRQRGVPVGQNHQAAQ